MWSGAFARTLIALVLFAGLAVLAGTVQAASAAVAIDGFRFLPQSVTVNVGETVTWTDRDAAQHTATSPGAFDTGVLAMGQSRTIQMNTAGTFDYRCAIHGAMTGTVRVLALATPTPAPTPAATPVPTAAPPTAVPTASPTPPPTPTTAPTLVAQVSPRPQTDAPAPSPPSGGPVPDPALLAVLVVAGSVGLGVYLARRRSASLASSMRESGPE